MSSLFLLDRGMYSVSFSERPDPSLAVWFDFPMLDLPTQKFGGLDHIPLVELYAHIKNDVSTARRALQSASPSVIISTGRACLVHCELILEKAWRGRNVFIDFQGDINLLPERVTKRNTLFVASDDQFVGKLTQITASKGVCDARVPIESFRIDEYIQDHFILK